MVHHVNVLRHMANVYENANPPNHPSCIIMYEKALKKYKYSKKVWNAYQSYHIRNNNIDLAKKLLSRSMQSLSKHKHIETLMKYALCEYDYGNIDRGRVIFEDIIKSYPKRSDILHVYVDKEIKLGYYPQARQLFDRMCSSKINIKNLKVIYKKYLNFEKKYGNDETVANVLQKARESASTL